MTFDVVLNSVLLLFHCLNTRHILLLNTIMKPVTKEDIKKTAPLDFDILSM